jgi:hypothetical protein
MSKPVSLFHITAIDNLIAICQRGKLTSKNTMATQGINYQNIAHVAIQARRNDKAVINPPGGTIHDYVPFYFAPRSPMLSAIHNGNVENCILKQDEILHFETTVERITAENPEFVFFDRNSSLGYSQSFTDLSKLETEIAWDLITESPTLDGYCKYFFNNHSIDKYFDRMERRQAGFLIKHQVHLTSMTRIGVMNKPKAEIVREILATTGVNLSVEVKIDWYF